MLARISGRTGDQLRGVVPSIGWHRLLAQSQAGSYIEFAKPCAPAGVNYFTRSGRSSPCRQPVAISRHGLIKSPGQRKS
jgi:hypothetical protein